MKKLIYISLMLCAAILHSQEDSLALEQEFDEERYRFVLDSINNSFNFQQGSIELGEGIATLQVPEGFKYLDGAQSNRVLTELWGNPPEETMGLLFPNDSKVMGDDFTYAIEITYSEDGYIDDEDAEEIDYDELLETMKEDTKEQNEYRRKMGYGAIEMIGWASKPFYDSNTKKLHWAKELRFEGENENTLNYNIRILGRKGYLNMNAISYMEYLPLVRKNIDNIIASAEFTPGNRYSDFNPDLDEVAAYGVGGLIAGKILAKTGFFALVLKFWKFIALGAVGLFGAFRRKIFGAKE
ncbi:MAG: DUF2167 domain-containing protein [Bacteroidota bacterium]